VRFAAARRPDSGRNLLRARLNFDSSCTRYLTERWYFYIEMLVGREGFEPPTY
jgi:hypothetical protein